MTTVTPMPIAAFEAEILALYKPPMRAAATRVMMAQALRELRSLEAVTTTADLTPGLIARWIDRFPRSSQRTLALLRCIRVACNVAVRLHWLTVSPFTVRPLRAWIRRDARPSRNAGRVYRRSQAEVQQLLRLLDDEAPTSWQCHRLQALVYTYVYTAFRRNEALHLLARNVDLAAESITIEPLSGVWMPKTVASAHAVPMAGALKPVLASWLPVSRWEAVERQTGYGYLFPGSRCFGPWVGGSGGYDAFSQIRAAARRAGLGDVTPIYMRKWFGTQAKALGLGRLEVQGFLGHACPYTQAAYDEEKVESLRPAAAKLSLFYGAQA